MAFVPKGAKWPRNAEEYPRHPDWLTVRQTAELLGCSPQSVGRMVYDQHVLTPVKKVWRYGCWTRRALFFSRYEVEQLKLRRAATKRPKLVGKPIVADPRLVNVNPLRQWRKEQGRPVRDIAAEVGTSEWQIAGWEHGRSDPSIPMLELLAKMMDCDLEDLKMRWAAWRILMLAPLPKKGRVQIKLDFTPSKDIPDEVA